MQPSVYIISPDDCKGVSFFFFLLKLNTITLNLAAVSLKHEYVVVNMRDQCFFIDFCIY